MENNKNKELLKQYIDKHNLENIVSGMVNSLVHEKAERPIEYMIKYLAGLMTKEEMDKACFVIPGPFPTQVQRIPKINSKFTLLKKHLTNEIFDKLKNIKSEHGYMINDLLDMKGKYGISLLDGDCIERFDKVVIPMIESIHGVKVKETHYEYMNKNQLLYKDKEKIFINNEALVPYIKVLRFKWVRNISEISFACKANEEELKKVCDELTVQIESLKDEYSLSKYTYKDNEIQCKGILKEIEYDNKEESKSKDYQIIYSNEDHTIVLLINFNEHLQLIVSSKEGNITEVYNKGVSIIKKIELEVQYETNKHVGYITSNFDILGSAIEVYCQLNFIPNEKEDKAIKDILKNNYDHYQFTQDNSLITISSYKLSYQNDKSFIKHYFSILSGLIILNSKIANGLIDLNSLKRIKLPSQSQDQYIKESYDSTFDTLRYKISSFGVPLNHIMNYYINDQLNPFGVLFHDENEYFIYDDFIHEYLSKSQNFDYHKKNHIHKIEDNPIVQIDEEDKEKIVYTSVCLIRNIEGQPFPTSENSNNEQTEKMIINALSSLNVKSHYGDYYSLYDHSQKDIANKIIEDNQLMIFNRDDMKKFNMQSDFPKGRGVIQFEKENTFAVVNDVDHIKFYLNVNSPCDSLTSQLVNVLKISNDFEKSLKFLYNERTGFITACPRFIGTGLLLKIQIKLGTLERDDIEYVMKGKEFAWKIVKDVDNKEYLIELINKYTIGLSETEVLTKLLGYINELFEVEKKGRKDD